MHLANSDDKRKPQCVLCKGTHSANNCDVTDHQKQLEIVKDNSPSLNLSCLSQYPALIFAAGNARKSITYVFAIASWPNLQQVPVVSRKQMENRRRMMQKTGITTPTDQLLIPTKHCKATEMISTCLLKRAVA